MKQSKRIRSRLVAVYGPFLGSILLLAAQAAHADQISIVSEVFSDSNSVVSVACYNGGGSRGPDGLNCSPAGFVWQSSPFASVSGNVDTTGTATSASERLTLNSPTGQTAVAYGAGDLSAGIVRSLTSGSSDAEGVSNVSMQDSVHFSIAGADSSTITPIQVVWTFDGTLSGPFLGFSGTPVTAQSSLQFGGLVSASEDIFGGPPTLTGLSQSGWVSGSFSSETAALVQFTGVYDLVGSSATLPMMLSLSTSAADGDTADFSNTSQIQMILPSNVTFTSDSGVFLTPGPITAAPEPSSIVLFGAVSSIVFARLRALRRKPQTRGDSESLR